MRRASFFLVSIIVAMLYVSAVAFAQQNLRPYPSKSGFGYINSVGVFVIPAIFRKAGYFSSSGIAHVIDQNRKHGYIDVKGNYVVAPMFDDLESPHRPNVPMRFAVGIFPEVKYGYINTNGELIVPAIYDHAGAFSNGLARVTMYGEGPIGRRPAKNGFVDTQGRLAIPLKFDDVKSFGPNGFAGVRNGERWGFITANGEYAIEPKFDDVLQSHESAFDSFGLARVKQDSYWILIDGKGRQVGPNTFDSIGEFNANGLAVVGKSSFLRGRLAGVINTKGEYVFQPQFDNFLGYKNGFAQVSLNGKWGYIDTRGNIVVTPRFPIYSSDFDPTGIAQVVLTSRPKPGGALAGVDLTYGYINTAGELILQDGQYDRIVMPYNETGFAVVRKGMKSGFINKEGNEAVGWFDEASPFSETGLAAVKEGEKWGYVDKLGHIVISPKFDGAYRFLKNGTAIVHLAGKWGHINTNGEFITQPVYDKLGTFSDDGLATATLNGEKGYVDIRGKFSVFPQPTP